MDRGKKWTWELVDKWFFDNGGKLITDHYENNKQKLQYLCHCGEIHERKFVHLQRMRKICPRKSVWMFDEVNQWFSDNACTLITVHYKNNKQKLVYQCSCGETHVRSFDTARQHGVCVADRKLPIEIVQERFHDHDRELIREVKPSKDGDRRFEYRCLKCDGIFTIILNSLSKEQMCRGCFAKLRKTPYEQVLTAYHSLDLEILSDPSEHNGSRSRLLCKCNKCGYLGTSVVGEITRGRRPCNCAMPSGENHYKWKQDKTMEEREYEHAIPGITSWRTEVFKKYDFTCQRCRMRGGKLNAHHIYNFWSHKELRLDVSNGFCFCKSCHVEFHKRFGKKYNNMEQVIDFLSDVDDMRKEADRNTRHAI
jgi:hypothetical protein